MISKPNQNLFDRIITAVHQEKEFKQTKKILLAFLLLLAVAVISMPFSLTFFVSEWRHSGISYFISSAVGSTGVFAVYWQDFLLSVVESMPVIAIVIFLINLGLLLFTLRLFMYKKQLLLKYLVHAYGAKS
jgi:hypothetical protein